MTTPTADPPRQITQAKTTGHETVEFIKKGQVTIPKRIRDAYHIEPGQKGELIEIDGAILILPRQSQTPALFEAIREELGTSEMSLEEMILEMRTIRETSDGETKAKNLP